MLSKQESENARLILLRTGYCSPDRTALNEIAARRRTIKRGCRGRYNLGRLGKWGRAENFGECAKGEANFASDCTYGIKKHSSLELFERLNLAY